MEQKKKSETYTEMVHRLTKPMGHRMDLIHAALGVTSEAGELADLIKGHIIYGRELDLVNFVEEAGDLLFFVELALQKIGLTSEDARRANMAKLNCRYEEGYSDAAANGRKKELEREAISRATWLKCKEKHGNTN